MVCGCLGLGKKNDSYWADAEDHTGDQVKSVASLVKEGQRRASLVVGNAKQNAKAAKDGRYKGGIRGLFASSDPWSPQQRNRKQKRAMVGNAEEAAKDVGWWSGAGKQVAYEHKGEYAPHRAWWEIPSQQDEQDQAYLPVVHGSDSEWSDREGTFRAPNKKGDKGKKYVPEAQTETPKQGQAFRSKKARDESDEESSDEKVPKRKQRDRSASKDVRSPRSIGGGGQSSAPVQLATLTAPPPAASSHTPGKDRPRALTGGAASSPPTRAAGGAASSPPTRAYAGDKDSARSPAKIEKRSPSKPPAKTGKSKKGSNSSRGSRAEKARAPAPPFEPTAANPWADSEEEEEERAPAWPRAQGKGAAVGGGGGASAAPVRAQVKAAAPKGPPPEHDPWADSDESEGQRTDPGRARKARTQSKTKTTKAERGSRRRASTLRQASELEF